MLSIFTRLKQAVIPIKGLLVVSLVRLINWLPYSLTKTLSGWLGRLIFRFSAKRRNVVMTNLAIAFPDKNEKERLALAKQASESSGKLLAEFPRAWLSSQLQIERQIVEVVDKQLIEDFSRDNQPVIIATPHIGNWEFFVQWIQINFPIFGLYSPSKIPQLDKLILDARKKFGCHPFPADNRGVLNLLRKLKKGGIMVILPDQVPKVGGGIYTPFFGESAYTMTLLHKMIQKTGAKLLFAYCIRRQQKDGFEVVVEKPEFDDQQVDVALFNLGLNAQLERIISDYPEQYIWDYKRYKNQQDGRNLYRRK